MDIKKAQRIIRSLDEPKYTNEEKVQAIFKIANEKNEKEVYGRISKLELLDILRWLLEHPAKVWSK